MLRHQAVRTVPLLVYLNKQDVEHAVAVERLIDKFLDTASNLGERDCRVQPLAALHGSVAKPNHASG